MQGPPIDYDFSAAYTEKTAEIDHGSAHLPVLVDRHGEIARWPVS